MEDMTQADLWPAPTATGRLDAVVAVPGSKSLSNRYLVLAAMGNKPVDILGLLRSRDTELMMDALRALGVICAVDGQDPTHVTVTPPVDGVFNGDVDIYCGLAGTVMRFVPPMALYADGPVRFDGDGQAYQRPMGPLLDGLEQLGARIVYEGEYGHLPFTVFPPASFPENPHGEAAQVRIDSSSSSQFVSGLLLAASRLPDGMTLRHEGHSLPSMPHIRMTMEDIAFAGGSVTFEAPATWRLRHRSLQLPSSVTVEPDLSNAAPFLGAALIAGGSVSVPHWPAHTTQPGGLLPMMLRAFGAEVSLDGLDVTDADALSTLDDHHAGMLTVRGTGAIHGLGEYDLSAAGEIAPSIAAIAVFADRPSSLVGIGHLRGHETDRLHALVTEIERVGSRASELADGIAIDPVPDSGLHGAVMETYADHRMATFAAMLGLRIPGIEVVDVQTTRKTIPDFTGMWQAMLDQNAPA